MNIQKVDQSNIETAIRIQNEIFKQDCSNEIIAAANNLNNNEFYLIIEDEKPIGIFELYKFVSNKDTLWINWFGIIKSYRHRGFANMTLKHIEKIADSNVIRTFVSKSNKPACRLFDFNNFRVESYLNNKDKLSVVFMSRKSEILIFSKKIGNETYKNWDNRFIDVTGQIMGGN